MAGSEGWSETMMTNVEIQNFCDQVKPQVETITGVSNVNFKAVKYRNKPVKGGQYFLIKVHIGGEEYYHLSLFSPVDGKVMVCGVQQNKTNEDALEPFPI